jgi:hypothetical protein
MLTFGKLNPQDEVAKTFGTARRREAVIRAQESDLALTAKMTTN